VRCFDGEGSEIKALRYGLQRFGSDGGGASGDGRGRQVAGDAGVDDGRVPGQRQASFERGNGRTVEAARVVKRQPVLRAS